MVKVIVYSTPTCPWCSKAKEFLTEKSVSFDEKDVSADKDAAKELVDKSGQQGVPVLDIEGEIIVGFDPVAIEQALEKK